jgi:hypothetical protein
VLEEEGNRPRLVVHQSQRQGGADPHQGAGIFQQLDQLGPGLERGRADLAQGARGHVADVFVPVCERLAQLGESGAGVGTECAEIGRGRGADVGIFV